MQLTNFSSLLPRMESFHKYEGSFPERQAIPKDQQSFAELVHTYFPVLSHFAFSIVKDEESAKDIVQEVFVRYWNGNEEFREFASLKAWLYQSTRNRCLNELRSRQRSETHHTNASPREEPGEENILANIVKSETLASIYAIVNGMSPQMRAVFEMHFIEGMPVREIAVKLGITSKTVSNHRHNVLVALRTKFANDADALVLIWLFARSAAGEI